MESLAFKMYTKKLHNLLLKAFHEVLEDPIFKRISINYVKLNRNKTFATVYLDLLSSDNPKLVLKKLNNLNSLFRNFLSEHLDKYRIPFFKFVEDKILQNAMRVDNLITKSIKDAQGS